MVNKEKSERAGILKKILIQGLREIKSLKFGFCYFPGKRSFKVSNFLDDGRRQ